MTSIISADEVVNRINNFITHFRSELDCMSNEVYMEHLIGLAKNKLEMFDSLEDECGWYWSEITEGRFDFEAHREEVHCLRSITKERLIDAYDRWFMPVCEKGVQKRRRGLVFQVIGSGDGDVSKGRPPTDPAANVGLQVDGMVTQFHATNKDTFGRITFGSLKRANTD